MVRYSENLIDEIKVNNDIVDVISQYVTLKRSGRNYFGLCPFHKEKSPSFSVSPDKQIFHCFGCGVGGNVTDKIVSSYEYPDAVVPMVDFLNGETVVAVADNRLMFYEGSKIPKSTKDVLLSDNIIGVYTGTNRVCLVCYDTTGENKYRIDLYDTKGRKTGSYCYSMDFKDILVGNDVVLIYNEGQCIVVDAEGNEKYNNMFEDQVQFIATTGSDKKYLFVKEMSLDTVRFE